MGLKLSQKAKGISSIIGSCLFYLVLGSTYIWGSINIYAISYFKNISSDEAMMVFPVGSLVSNITILLSFPFLSYFGFRKMVYTSIFFLFGFFFGSTFCPDFWSFFCLFGIGFGMSTGLLYLTMMYNNYKYFPTKRGLIGGIGMGVYGFSSLISNYILLMLINPDNVAATKDPNSDDYSFPPEIADRLPSALRYLSFYFLGVMILGSIFLFEYKEPEEEEVKADEIFVDVAIEEQSNSMLEQKSQDIRRDLLPKSLKNESDVFNAKIDQNNFNIARTANPNSQIEPDITNFSDQKEEIHQNKQKIKDHGNWSLSSFDLHDERRCFSVKDAFKSRIVYIMIAMIYMSVSNGYFMATNFKNYGIRKISNDQFLTLVGSLGSVFNGGGRFFWGFLSDKFNFKKIYLTILIIQMVNIVTLRFISSIEIAYLLWVCSALLCEGGHFVIFPPLSLKVFGPNVGSKIYSILILVCSLSNLTQFGLNLGLRPLIGFENEFYIYLGMTTVAFVLCISSDLRYRK